MISQRALSYYNSESRKCERLRNEELSEYVRSEEGENTLERAQEELIDLENIQPRITSGIKITAQLIIDILS
jgi:hypothetical protein